MPDFFDRLIARGTQQPGGAAVTFALPRLPGPFERLADQAPGPFLEAVDETREVDAARPGTPRARPALGRLAGTQAAITPPSLLRDAATPPQQAPLLPRATPVHLVADAGVAAPDQASTRASRPEYPIPPPLSAAVAVTPRTLAVPASAVRAARSAADEARTAQAQPAAPPPVTVRIGRIEVRNWGQDRRERQPKRRASRAAPKQTLADYLAAASGGRTGSGVRPGGA
jgi:hypothetical protein